MRKITFRLLLQYVVALGVGSLGPLRPATVEAEETSWIGHGSAFCDPNDPSSASFFDCSHWSNNPPCCCDTCSTFAEPVCSPECAAGCDGDGEADTVFLGTSHDPDPAQDAPRNLYFGAFCSTLGGLCPSTETIIAAGDAYANNIRIEDGAWTFDFGSGSTPGCSLPPPSEGSLAVWRLILAEPIGSSASLNVRNGTLHSTFVVHIAPGPNTSGAVIVEGVNTQWTVDGYVDLGWVGDGLVVVRDGAQMSSGAVYAGIRDGASGALEVTDGGRVTLGDIHVGFGHESTGTASGRLLVSDRDSSLAVTTGWITVGGISTGSAEVRNGGAVLVSLGGVSVSGPQDAPSSLLVSDLGSSLRIAEQLIVASTGGRAALNIAAGGQVSSSQGILGDGGTGAHADAKVIGPRSKWEISDYLRVGSEADTGNLTVSRNGVVAVGAKLEITPNGTVTVASGGTITVGDCLGLLKKRSNAIFVCPGGTFIADGTVNARVVDLTPR